MTVAYVLSVIGTALALGGLVWLVDACDPGGHHDPVYDGEGGA